jgi:hypothetical protein
MAASDRAEGSDAGDDDRVPTALLSFRSDYADIGITAVMPRGWLCRVEVPQRAFLLLSAILAG